MIGLNIDTSILRSSVSVAQQANEAISEAANLLNAITVHDDWICTERDRIKEMTLSNKQKAQQIQEKSSSFYSAIQTASERFDSTEQDSCRRINGVDDIIGRITTIVPKISENVHGGSGSGTGISIMDLQGLGEAVTKEE